MTQLHPQMISVSQVQLGIVPPKVDTIYMTNTVFG